MSSTATPTNAGSRRLPIAIAYLIGIAALVVPPKSVFAQPSEESDDRAAVLHRLIFDVEARKRVLMRSQGSLIAVTADQVGELFASMVLSGEMPPDSIVPRSLRVREMSDAWLLEIKRELVSLEGTRSAPSDVRLQWNGAPGTWAVACDGRYPPEVHGRIDEVYMMRPPSQEGRLLHVALYRGYTLVRGLSGTVIGSAASGQETHVEMPGNDILDVLTLVWDAEVTETTPAGDAVEGTIVASGALTFTGNDGSCRGRWHSP